MATEFELRQSGRARSGTDEARGETGQNKRPFDTSGMNWDPELEDDDPPYRDWWVVNDESDE